jgi:hypothetical protein
MTRQDNQSIEERIARIERKVNSIGYLVTLAVAVFLGGAVGHLIDNWSTIQGGSFVGAIAVGVTIAVAMWAFGSDFRN